MRNGRYIMLALLIGIFVLVMVTGINEYRTIQEIEQDLDPYIVLDGMEQKGSGELKEYYGIGSDDVEGYFLYGPVSITDVNELAVIKANSKEQSEEIRRAVENRNREQFTRFNGYKNQQELLKNATIEVRGKFVLYAVGKDNRAIADAFAKAVRE